MKLVDYEKYYHMNSEFIIPRDEFEKIIEENQKIKKYYEYDIDASKEIIAELEKENQRLNDDIKILLKENEAKEKVIIKYENVLNELEKWLEEKQDLTCGCGITLEYIIVRYAYKNCLEKLNELKESDK